MILDLLRHQSPKAHERHVLRPLARRSPWTAGLIGISRVRRIRSVHGETASIEKIVVRIPRARSVRVVAALRSIRPHFLC